MFMLTLKQLEALIWIVRLSTFERAADRLNTTQSARWSERAAPQSRPCSTGTAAPELKRSDDPPHAPCSPPRLMALQTIFRPNRRESLPTPSAGDRIRP